MAVDKASKNQDGERSYESHFTSRSYVAGWPVTEK